MQGCVEPDNVSPTIEVLSITPEPTTALVCGQLLDNVSSLNSSDTLEITLRLSDDQELSQYKVELHNNFACHGHSGKVETVDWYVISIEDVDGAEQTVTRKFPVPTNVTTGNYHFHVFATDAAGNNALTAAIYSLNVTNTTDTEAPVLSTTVPASSNFTAQKGTPINFQGNLADNNPLGEGTNGRLILRYWSATNPVITLYEEDLDNAVAETYDFNFDADVPATVVDGTYIFELSAFDAVNNPSNTIEYTVEIN
jgi:hypothetical protein